MHSASAITVRVIGLWVIGAAIAHSVTAAPLDDACSLLTPAQVGSALGVPVDAGTYVVPTFKKTCTWNAAGGGGSVTLNLQSLDQYAVGKNSPSYGQSVNATPIGGIGDEAYFFGTGKLASLIVKKGGVAFKIAVYSHISVEKQQIVEKSLALQVVSQL